MGMPVSIRLADEVRETLEEEARERGVGLSALLREIATAEARRVRKERIRRRTEELGRYIASNPEAKEFFEDWGTPTAEI